MAYSLTPDLKTDNLLIDREHEELFSKINALMDACSQGKGRAEIENTLKFLNEYIVKHFSDEEQLQRQVRYPFYTQHKQYHETYKKTVAEIIAEFQKSGATIALVAKANTAIAGWLVNHIKQEDKKLAAFIRDSQK